MPSPRRDVVWNTYRECDARCSASHLSLIQPSVRAFTPPSTRILEMITAALSTTTAPTISSIWVLDLAHDGPPALYRLDVLRAVLYRTEHDLRGACSSASRLWSDGHRCIAFGVPMDSGTARFSAAPYTCNMPLESIEATVVTVRVSAVCTAGGTPMTSQTAVIPVVEPEIRWRNWQARDE